MRTTPRGSSNPAMGPARPALSEAQGQASVPLLEQDPRGRMDVAVVRGARVICGVVEKTLGGVDLWDGYGIGEVVEAAVVEHGVPREFTTVDLARNIGLLPKKSVVPRRPDNRKRGRR